MPLPKVKKSIGTTLLKFRKPSMEDIVVSDDEVLTRASVEKNTTVQNNDEEEIPLNQEGLQKETLQEENLIASENLHQKVTKQTTNIAQKNRKMNYQRKRKTTSDEECSHLTKKRKLPVKEVLENQEPDKNGMATILSLWMILWHEGIMNQMTSILKRLTIMALKDKMITAKKIVFLMQQGICNMLKDQKLAETELEQFSIEDFVKLLQDQELFTTYTRHWVCQEDADWITNNYIKCLPEQCSLSSTIATTSTLSTTARTPIAVVDVNFPSTSKGMTQESAGDILDQLFRHSSTPSSIGAIQQSIARRDGDYVITLKSPGECGYRVIKLDVYDYSKICNLPKEQWWKQATYRSTFLTSSPVDQKEVLVEKLLSLAAVELKKIPKVQKEEKVMKSFGFYKNDRHHQ